MKPYRPIAPATTKAVAGRLSLPELWQMSPITESCSTYKSVLTLFSRRASCYHRETQWVCNDDDAEIGQEILVELLTIGEGYRHISDNYTGQLLQHSRSASRVELFEPFETGASSISTLVLFVQIELRGEVVL